jgi:TonB family protein
VRELVFTELPPPNRKRWDICLLASFSAHAVALLVLTYHSKPVFIMPSDVQLGTPGSSGSIVYLAPTGPELKQEAVEKPKLQIVVTKKPAIAPPKPLPDVHENENGRETAKLDATAQVGSLYGTRVPGAPLTGHEIIPALPQVFPDPAVSRSDLPPGIQGDVVVEVTIDEQGNVVELKLIRGIGYGIEERVLATLKRWHFRPASKDGTTIASQHIVTFHYPS